MILKLYHLYTSRIFVFSSNLNGYDIFMKYLVYDIFMKYLVYDIFYEILVL